MNTNVKKIKEYILLYLKENEDVALCALPDHPEIIEISRGDMSWNFPIKGIENSNIIMVYAVTSEFITALYELEKSKKIEINETSELVARIDSNYIPPFQLAKKLMEYKTPRWIPMIVKKGTKF